MSNLSWPNISVYRVFSCNMNLTIDLVGSSSDNYIHHINKQIEMAKSQSVVHIRIFWRKDIQSDCLMADLQDRFQKVVFRRKTFWLAGILDQPLVWPWIFNVSRPNYKPVITDKNLSPTYLCQLYWSNKIVSIEVPDMSQSNRSGL